MPVYMDLHVGQGLTAEDVAMAHQADLKMQDKFNCHCLTYWVDESRGNAYCLIDAPDRETVYELHRNSHKQLPDEIIEVDRRVIKAFLGRIHDPEVVDYMIDQKIKVFNDPAFRVMLLIQLKDKQQIIFEEGVETAEKLLKKFGRFSKGLIEKNNGMAAESEGWELVATFTSSIQAVSCAIDIWNFLQSEVKRLGLKMVVHAGQPIDKSQKLFGEVLDLGRFINYFRKENTILVSYTVKNLMESAQNSSILITPGLKSLSKNDEDFLEKLRKIIAANWQDSRFEMEACRDAMNMSKSQFYRKCIESTGLSFNRLLREYRLQKALGMLISTNLNVAEVSFEAGFNSPSYFTKCFQNKFGLKPNLYNN